VAAKSVGCRALTLPAKNIPLAEWCNARQENADDDVDKGTLYPPSSSLRRCGWWRVARALRRCSERLLVHIRAIHAEMRGACGWPRIWRELASRGIRVGKDRVRRLMQLHGVRAKGKRRLKVTTDSAHDLTIAPNLLGRNFVASAPDRAWVGDITYIPTDEGWLFLAVVLDLFRRSVIGWSLRDDMPRDRARCAANGMGQAASGEACRADLS
jgi:transposase InsO family protein